MSIDSAVDTKPEENTKDQKAKGSEKAVFRRDLTYDMHSIAVFIAITLIIVTSLVISV